MAERFDLVVRAGRAVVEGREVTATVGVRDGRVAEVAEGEAGWRGAEEVELADDEVLLPGLVDTHVHVNEPGRTEWEGFATATRAAAAGGVTTIVDMPLNSIPPTTDPAALEVKRAAARGRVWVDVGFWGGAVPGNEDQLTELHEAGVLGFKCFLVDSGVPEFPPLDRDGLRRAMETVAALDTLLVVHAEDPAVLAEAPSCSGPDYAAFLASRPRRSEEEAVAVVVAAARETGARVHVLHLSDADALPLLREARAEGVRVTVETCPHYLTFAAEEIPPGGTAYKCCPPIREGGNREALWQGLRDGDIDIVVSDHSPSDPALKALDTGDFGTAWGGISSLQLGLSAVWTGARRRGLGLPDVVRWTATRPAEVVGLRRKGRISAGCDADLVVLAPEEELVVDPARLRHRHPLSPYAGRTLRGVVRQTWLRGRPVGGRPHGRLVRRGEA